MRFKIPAHIEAKLLFLNRHTCCYCRERNKDVQIHHIDTNNNNNKFENLAVLCLDCHSKVTGNRGLGRKFTRLEVYHYKKEWEQSVKRQFGNSQRRTHKVPRVERELFTFEIKKLVYEMMAVDDNNKAILESHFENLLNIAIFEDLTDVVIDVLKIPFSLVSDAGKNKPIFLAKYLPDFFEDLFGPMEMKLSKKEERTLLGAIETLHYIHVFSVEENKHYNILSSIKQSLEDFIAIAIEHRSNRIFRKCVKLLLELKTSSDTIYYKKDRKLPKLKAEIDKAISIIQKDVKKKKLSWNI